VKRCEEKGINIEELRAGSRRGSIPRVRAQLALQLVEEYGLPLAEVGRQVGVSTSAVCRIMSKKRKSKST
jgi:predicted transcriptional regulator